MTFAKETSLLIIGHRGAAGLAPENTLPSFQRALALQCEAVELDVHRVEDTLVVIHDHKLDRTTNTKGRVSELSLEDLTAIDAGDGAPIPTLTQVLSLAREYAGDQYQILVNIELKGAGTAELTASVIRAHWPHLKFLVSSFDHQALADFRSYDTTTEVAPLFGQWDPAWLGVAQQLNASHVNLAARICTPRRIAEIRTQGYPVFAYTVNSVRSATRLAKMGVRGVFTDRPDRLLAAPIPVTAVHDYR